MKKIEEKVGEVFGVEVTPAVIAHGVSLLATFDPRFETDEDFVARFIVEVLSFLDIPPDDRTFSSNVARKK